MSLILVEDRSVSFGDLIISCWDEKSRISILASSNSTLDECLTLGIKAFESEYFKKPLYASLHKVLSLETSQTLGVQLN